MDRRHFLQSAALLAAAGSLSAARAQAPASAGTAPRFAPTPANGWRVFEVSTRLDLPAGTTRAWVPLPSLDAADWFKRQGSLWQGNAARMQVQVDPTYGSEMLVAEWSADAQAPTLEVTSRFATRDRALDLAAPTAVRPLSKSERALYTRATALLPTGGIVRRTALEITRGRRTDIDKARALYDWVVENTVRNPKTRGCGTGDIASMLESGDLSGKCADINALYVGLARAAGLPARDVYGIRVADSRFGYKSLGKSGDITKAQHCRAEVWLAGFGWVPVDPADVRKVALEEKPGLSLQDDLVVTAREKLFGAWEMNWLAYNVAHDVALPGSPRKPVPFLMYPQAENADGRLDSLDAANFKYSISSQELTA